MASARSVLTQVWHPFMLVGETVIVKKTWEKKFFLTTIFHYHPLNYCIFFFCDDLIFNPPCLPVFVSGAGDQALFTSLYTSLAQQLPREPMEWRRWVCFSSSSFLSNFTGQCFTNNTIHLYYIYWSHRKTSGAEHNERRSRGSKGVKN